MLSGRRRSCRLRGGGLRSGDRRRRHSPLLLAEHGREPSETGVILAELLTEQGVQVAAELLRCLQRLRESGRLALAAAISRVVAPGAPAGEIGSASGRGR